MTKKIILSMTMTLLVASCSNVSDDFSINEKDVKNTVIDTTLNERFLEASAARYRSYKRSSTNQNLIRTRATNNGTDIVVYGYTNKHSTGYKTYALDRELKRILGLYPNSFYICEFMMVDYTLTIPGIANRTAKFTDIDSPKCGLFPNHTKEEYNLRGYSYTRKGDKITLTTKIIHIKSDQAGINYDIWFPCKPESLEWIYNIENK